MIDSHPTPQLENYHKSHTFHNDDVERLKADIETKEKYIHDLHRKLDALKKVTTIDRPKSTILCIKTLTSRREAYDSKALAVVG